MYLQSVQSFKIYVANFVVVTKTWKLSTTGTTSLETNDTSFNPWFQHLRFPIYRTQLEKEYWNTQICYFFLKKTLYYTHTLGDFWFKYPVLQYLCC